MAIHNKLVSVIIPVYNAEKFLEDSINSVINQTYKNIEIILVDDGSDDGSASICKSFCEKDVRVKYFYKANGGASSSRNYGIEKAEGYYITFVDSDDKMICNCVERMVEATESTQSDLCVCGYEVLKAGGKMENPAPSDIISGQKNIANYFSKHFLKGVTSSVWGKLYKKEMIYKKFNTDFIMGEDILFNLEYIRNISKCCVIEECLYQYNQINPFSLVSNYRKVYFGQNKAACLEWLNMMDKLRLDDSFKINVFKRMTEALVNYCVFSVMNNCVKDSVKTIKETNDSIMNTAVKSSMRCFNIFQRFMLLLYTKRLYTALVCYIKVYLLIKK